MGFGETGRTGGDGTWLNARITAVKKNQYWTEVDAVLLRRDRKQSSKADLNLGTQHMSQLCIIQESQPVKNRNLSRLLANISRLNWSSQRNCVYCFSTVFITLLQQQEVPSTC